MPTRKTLKSVEHNIGHSLLSLMTYNGHLGLYYFQILFNIVTKTERPKMNLFL